jgi:hypothetical protein
MSFTATVEKGTIKLPPGVHLPDGTRVTVEPAIDTPAEAPAQPQQSFAERYAKYVGCVDTGLGDLAKNHDHYLYGATKREE